MFNKIIKSFCDYAVTFFKWLALGVLIGALGGTIGAAFAKMIAFVTEARLENPWIILLLPLSGVISVLLYRWLKVTDIGTNRVFESVRSETKVPYLLAPAVFIGAGITHLFGGSAGREGAALQLGGSVAATVGAVLHLDKKTQHILTMCGMGAFFSALFGTPIGAAVFALEVVSVGHICSAAIFPAAISSISAVMVASALGVEPERFFMENTPSISVGMILKITIIAVASAIVSILFCRLIHLFEHWCKKLMPNSFVRILVGGVVIVLLTAAVGSQEYNGGGIETVTRIFESGQVRYEAFLLKILFTVVTVSVGFKGGEIVPTFFIGATLGATVGTLLGVQLGLSAAVGMAAMFCGVTNCPLATVVLCVELFGGQGFVFCALATVVSFLLSGKSGLYTGQQLVYSKLSEDEVNENAG